MATIASARWVRVTTEKKRTRPHRGFGDALTLFFWGRTAVSCEECGLSLRPAQAVWRGAHPYCSIGHEAVDSL